MLPTKTIFLDSAIELYCSQERGCKISSSEWREKSDELVKHLIETDLGRDIPNNALVALDYMGLVQVAYDHEVIDKDQFELIKMKNGKNYFVFNSIAYIDGDTVQKDYREINFRSLIDLLPD